MAFERWLSALRELDPTDEAPHRPLLLLTVLKAAERDGDYRVIVANLVFDEDSPDQTPLKHMVGRRIRLPREERYWPLTANLAAHRKLHRF